MRRFLNSVFPCAFDSLEYLQNIRKSTSSDCETCAVFPRRLNRHTFPLFAARRFSRSARTRILHVLGSMGGCATAISTALSYGMPSNGTTSTTAQFPRKNCRLFLAGSFIWENWKEKSCLAAVFPFLNRSIS